MIRIKYILAGALLLFFLSSCSAPKNDLAFDPHAANIQNGGYAVSYHDGVLYADPEDHDALYYCQKDGTTEKIAGKRYYYEMNVCGDTLYYVSGEPGNVWRLSLNTKDEKKLIGQKVGNLLVYPNKLFYRLSEEDDWGKLFCADLNGKQKKLLAENVRDFCLYEDRIYYSDFRENTICSMKTDGTEAKILQSADASGLFVENDCLVYADKNRGGNLFTYDLLTEKETCICEDTCWNINGNKERIFYRNQSDGGSLYSVRFDGTEKQCLIHANIYDIVVLENELFYRDVVQYGSIFSYVLS